MKKIGKPSSKKIKKLTSKKNGAKTINSINENNLINIYKVWY